MANRTTDKAYERARDAASQAGDMAREGYSRAEHAVNSRLSEYPEARRYADYGRDYAYYGRDRARERVRESPLSAILAAGLAGYAIAYLVHRGRRLRRGESLPEYARSYSRYHPHD